MSKKGEEKEAAVAVADERTIAKKLAIVPVGFVDQGVEVQNIEGLPEEFKRSETLSGFPPSPDWKKAGDALFGYFVGQRDGIGPNNSRIYEIAVPRKDEEPLTVAVWGSAALDRLMDSCFPKLVTGDKVGIIYVGEKATKRGLNPVKLFALKVVRPDGKGSQAAAH
jgi:hypothetical protein